jgi:hypothetical protein
MADLSLEPYDEVHALLLGWELDDLEKRNKKDPTGNKAMRVSLSELAEVLDDHFCYKTYSEWSIPCDNATDKVFERLRVFRDDHKNPRTLLIIYYAGHGTTDAYRRLVWVR